MIGTNYPPHYRFPLAGELFKGDEARRRQKTEEEQRRQNLSFMPGTGQNTDMLNSLMVKHRQGDVYADTVRAQNEAELMQKLIIMYFCTVRTKLIDTVVKTMMRHMVRDMNRPNQETMVPDWLITSHVT